jgi:hypothetical protein
MSREIMQQALDALKQTFQFQQTRDVIAALEAELAKPEQDTHCKYCNGIGCVTCDARCLPEQEPKLTDAGADTNIDPFTLYPKGSGMVTMNQHGMRVDLKDAPPRKEWVGLTDEEMSDIYNRHYNDYVSNDIGIVDVIVIAHAIEAKLKEKNNAHT